LPVRIPGDLSPNAPARALSALRAQGAAMIDLTESNPTRVGLEYPPHLLDALADARALRYDPHPLGLMSAREAVAREFQRRGLSVAPDRIALTASSSEAYGFLFKLLCRAGDAVLVPRPSYPLFDYLTALESVEAIPYRIEYHGVWRIDVDGVRRVLNDRVRALLVVSPNNPTGSILHADDLVSLAGLCQARDLPIIGDEVFADYPLDPAPHASSVLDCADIVTLSLGGLSKAAGLPQLKLGWIAFNGPADRVSRMIARYEVVADAYLSVATPVQVAAQTLCDAGARIRHQIQQRLRVNLAALRAAVAAYPAARVLPVEGGWSAVIQLPATRSEETLVLNLLAEDHVIVHPGYFFDFERESFVVISLIVEPAVFARGVALLLARAIDSADQS
jgi:aspartate/methionine/tyrosine aminotransferase